LRRLLLDTHTLLWWLKNDPQLGEKAREYIADAGNQVYVSAVSNWEISIKKAINKLEAPNDMDSIIENRGFLKLPVSNFHGDMAGELPFHHKDPFDRMLIAQAQCESLVIVSKDGLFSNYSVQLINALQ
jgi:PIN domain nuclease of toxin-antitoxin system